ncbi:MAG: hypothetical protein INF78_01480 [Roseomonas sp.]|nr:hypothetical protein [Roseomonas sp.]
MFNHRSYLRAAKASWFQEESFDADERGIPAPLLAFGGAFAASIFARWVRDHVT